MKATISSTAGYCILGEESAGHDNVNNIHFISLTSLEHIGRQQVASCAGLISDWEVVDADSQDQLLLKAQQKHLTQTCVSLVRLTLLLKEGEHRNAVFNEIESSLATHNMDGPLLNNLLIAPLKKPEFIAKCAAAALALGFAASADLFNRLHNFQPILGRLSEHWLQLPALSFSDLDIRKEELWLELVGTGSLSKLLEASSSRAIKEIFGHLAFDRESVKAREALARLGKLLGDFVFPNASAIPLPEGKQEQDLYANAMAAQKNKNHLVPGIEKLHRAQREVKAIAAALAKGNDHQAKQYLHELIERQVNDDSQYAVKSLCNIAKLCAEMFRTDFESTCLNKAHALDPNDAWATIQLSDHLKRVGEYTEATQLVKGVMNYDSNQVAQSLFADIASQQGNFQTAIERYQYIENTMGSTKETRTAIADNLRKQGRLDEALNAYESLESDGYGSDRTLSGKAQIAARTGRLQEAIETYQSLVATDLDDSAEIVYRMTYANYLKQAGRLDEAVVVLEDVISRHPFAMQARVLRSSIHALRDELTLAESSLPPLDSSYNYAAYGEWVATYTRGLLLLKTENYVDARNRLVKSYSQCEKVLDPEQKKILRLAAALSWLAGNEITHAKEILSHPTPDVENAYLKYLHQVFQYHVSILENNSRKAQQIYQRLRDSKEDNPDLWAVVVALKKNDMVTAHKLEINAMLSLAA